MLSVYGTPVERYDDGSRELTNAERIEQIGWEIQQEESEALANLCAAKAREVDLRAGIPDHGGVAMHYRHAEDSQRRVASLRAELANLRGAL
jgi:hypothetical protein